MRAPGLSTPGSRLPMPGIGAHGERRTVTTAAPKAIHAAPEGSRATRPWRRRGADGLAEVVEAHGRGADGQPGRLRVARLGAESRGRESSSPDYFDGGAESDFFPASSTDLTRNTSASGANGFCKNSTSESKIPWCTIELSVKPET